MVRMQYLQFFLSLLVTLVCLMAYYYVKEGIVKLHHLSQLEKKLSLELQNKRRLISQVPINKIHSIEHSYHLISLKNPDILLNIIRITEESGFTIQTLQPLSIQAIAGVTILPVKVALVGDVRQLVKWLNLLKSSDINVGISDFSLNVDEHETMTIDMLLLVLGVHSISLPEMHQANILSIDIKKWIDSTSIDQLKLVGYLHNKYYWVALVKLPNGETQTVQVGSIIGLEKARIVSITENAVILMVGQKLRYLSFT